MFKQEVIKLIKNQLKSVDAESLLEIPPKKELGDYSFPCFSLAKELKKNPNDIAKELTKKIKPTPLIKQIQQVGPYINFFINPTKIAETTITEALKKKGSYGATNEGKGKTVVIDFSSPNIAKPFGIAHLRSTAIGNSISKIYQHLGYNCIGINHLGDWGTQFGKLIVAYKKWGDQKTLEKDPIRHLFNLYVKFHEEAKQKPELEDEAREWFKKIELKDKEAQKLWKKFSELSLKEFKKIYSLMNIKFDEYTGESFYAPLWEEAVKEAEKKGITEISDEALIVNLEKYSLPPCILRKKDGSTLYATRDIAAAKYRYQKYRFYKMIYVVDHRQSLHFQQLFKVLELMGYEWAKNCEHVPFGLMRFPEGTMSTRKGKIIFFEEVIEKAKQLVKEVINKKNPQLKNKEEVAEAVALGAIIFWDLSNDRMRNISFDWEKVLDFEGETGPYVQYTYARADSIIRKANEKLDPQKINFEKLTRIEELNLIKTLAGFTEAVKEAKNHNKPSIIARYLLDLAQNFNEFYHKCPCISEKDEEIRRARISLVEAAKQGMEIALSLLGIKALPEM
ncbi:arginine--tRNA ligase [Candidatus Woesearchaeota archaeon]|nr:arginine--tRNA ligase [Candidatus Woesearchaeota archaeon]